jgi:hypothetical protein
VLDAVMARCRRYRSPVRAVMRPVQDRPAWARMRAGLTATA